MIDRLSTFDSVIDLAYFVIFVFLHFLASPIRQVEKEDKARVDQTGGLVLTGDDRSLVGKLKEIVPASEEEQVRNVLRPGPSLNRTPKRGPI